MLFDVWCLLPDCHELGGFCSNSWLDWTYCYADLLTLVFQNLVVWSSIYFAVYLFLHHHEIAACD